MLQLIILLQIWKNQSDSIQCTYVFPYYMPISQISPKYPPMSVITKAPDGASIENAQCHKYSRQHITIHCLSKETWLFASRWIIITLVASIQSHINHSAIMLHNFLSEKNLADFGRFALDSDWKNVAIDFFLFFVFSSSASSSSALQNKPLFAQNITYCIPNIEITFLCIGNFQWCIYKTKSKSDWLFSTPPREGNFEH